ncbi:MAG: T9SS type A sorting domain-containing protein [Bacteroidia bacterium]
MRKTLLAVFSAIALTASAQVTLSFPVHGWIPGDVQNTNSADTVGVNPGPGGTGQTWNFSSLVIGAAASTPIVTPSSTPYGSSFPTATCAVSNPSGVYYYKSNASGLSVVGLGTPSYIMQYSDIDELMVYPFAYGNSNMETHTASYTISSFTGTRGGYTNATADGSGTLILPSGSYNVIRVRNDQEDRDSLGASGFITNSTTYSYYSATQKFPLLQIIFLTINSSSGPQNFKSVNVNSAVVGIAEENQLSAFNCFPNPASEQLNIVAELTQANTVQAELTDLTGRIVLSEQYGEQGAGTFTRTLDVANLPAGLYTLRVLSGTSVSQRKISIQ